MRLLRASGYLFLVLLSLTAAVMFLGSRLPVEHTATVTGGVPAPQAKVWALVTNVETQSGWRSGLRAVEMLPEQVEGKPCWREIQGAMATPLCVEESESPRRRVVRIADPKLPFGGTWTFELAPAGPDVTEVTITEHGTTGPAMWRFAGHYLAGEDREIRRYLDDLQAAAGRR